MIHFIFHYSITFTYRQPNTDIITHRHFSFISKKKKKKKKKRSNHKKQNERLGWGQRGRGGGNRKLVSVGLITWLIKNTPLKAKVTRTGMIEV